MRLSPNQPNSIRRWICKALTLGMPSLLFCPLGQVNPVGACVLKASNACMVCKMQCLHVEQEGTSSRQGIKGKNVLKEYALFVQAPIAYLSSST